MNETSRLEVFINSAPGETRLAVTDNGKLVDLVIAREGATNLHGNLRGNLRGNIYLGRVEKVLAGLNAAFIDIGHAESGFLAANDGQIFNRDTEKPKAISALFKEGDSIVVQVTREASEGKGAKLTTRLDLVGRTIVATLGRPGVSISKSITDEAERDRLQGILAEYAEASTGLILRTKASAVPAEVLLKEAAALTDQISDIAAAQNVGKPPACLYEDVDPIAKFLQDHGRADWQRIVVDNRITLKKLSDYCTGFMPELIDLFELADDPVALFETHDLDQQMEDLFQLRVGLPSGGGLIIEETQALVAIDVDSGAHSRISDSEAFALAVNQEAAIEAARQIFLRNLAGQIVIDFLPMRRKENKEKVQSALSLALEDAGKCNIFGFSRLGLLEMTRQRNGESLAARFLSKTELALSDESQAIAVIRAVMRELDRNSGKALTVECGPKLYRQLTHNMQTVWHALLERTGPVVVLEEVPASSGNHFEIRVT
jgi:ribonuclease G